MSAEVTTFEGRMALEIDRLVVGAHERAAGWAAIATLREEPEWMGGAAPLMTTFGAPLLARPVGPEDMARVLRYLHPDRGAELFEVNITLGTVDRAGCLTDRGRELAERTLVAQEEAVADVWALEPGPLGKASERLAAVVAHVETLRSLRTPSAVELFAGTSDRPSVAGRVLRSITTLRYWRMDAHAVAQEAAGLTAPEAHALNRAWMAAAGTGELPGQGAPKIGKGAARSLTERGLLDGDAVTPAGQAVRDRIEAQTDELTAPVFECLDEAGREELYGALTTLPA